MKKDIFLCYPENSALFDAPLYIHTYIARLFSCALYKVQVNIFSSLSSSETTFKSELQDSHGQEDGGRG